MKSKSYRELETEIYDLNKLLLDMKDHSNGLATERDKYKSALEFVLQKIKESGQPVQEDTKWELARILDLKTLIK